MKVYLRLRGQAFGVFGTCAQCVAHADVVNLYQRLDEVMHEEGPLHETTVAVYHLIRSPLLDDEDCILETSSLSVLGLVASLDDRMIGVTTV